MPLTSTHHQQINAIDASAYADLWASCGKPAFYHPDLLAAAEQLPLLPISGTHYLAAWRNGRLEALLVSYQQNKPDPFGTLARTTGISFDRPEGGLLGHIAHCYDSRLLLRPDADPAAADLLLARLRTLSAELDIPGCGILNVADRTTLAAAERSGFAVNYMHDRFFIDLAPYRDFDEFVAQLPRHGRQEMKRQLRKFAAEGGTTDVKRAADADLEATVRLCHLTSAKNGTPHYYPVETFIRFLERCADLVSIVSVRLEEELVAAVVCIEEPDRLHMWAGGAVYDRSEFSPYTLMFAACIQNAFDRGFPAMETGRTNARIKARLGCSPQALYSALHCSPLAMETSLVDANCAV
jgi:uncharacterized protein